MNDIRNMKLLSNTSAAIIQEKALDDFENFSCFNEIILYYR